MANWPQVPEADFSASQAIENIGPLDTKNRPPKGLRLRFQWHKVNDSTWKLASDESIRVPACHGFWGGYQVPKAVAWVIQLSPARWLARCRDQASGPSSLNEAKALAMAMAKGSFGDFEIRKPIEHLNGLTARLLDRENSRAASAGTESGS
jgi:hypothetical protein